MYIFWKILESHAKCKFLCRGSFRLSYVGKPTFMTTLWWNERLPLSEEIVNIKLSSIFNVKYEILMKASHLLYVSIALHCSYILRGTLE